jgi:hypothetical protein
MDDEQRIELEKIIDQIELGGVQSEKRLTEPVYEENLSDKVPATYQIETSPKAIKLNNFPDFDRVPEEVKLN